jgi:hypothetical protein
MRGFFALITGTSSPPRAIRELFLPPLDIDMPIRVPFGRMLFPILFRLS